MELRAQNLSHSYDGLAVLEDINLEITAGQIVCIVGPSGCGKSTLLRLLGGLERPASGRVVQVGAPASGTLNPLTYIFQDFALLPWRTAHGNISLVLEDHDLATAERARLIDDALAAMNLSAFARAYPRQLSGGMKQRIAIARALVVSPSVLLMDEPLSALDAQTRELLLDDLVALWQKRKFTAAYVTHNLQEAVRLGHEIIVMSRRPGRIAHRLAIDIPLYERAAADTIVKQHAQHLWDMMRDQARAADLEITGA